MGELKENRKGQMVAYPEIKNFTYERASGVGPATQGQGGSNGNGGPRPQQARQPVPAAAGNNAGLDNI